MISPQSLIGFVFFISILFMFCRLFCENIQLFILWSWKFFMPLSSKPTKNEKEEAMKKEWKKHETCTLEIGKREKEKGDMNS